MRKLFMLPALLLLCCALKAQYNMEAFRHLSIGIEAGLHGLGIEAAIPLGHHLVLKGGYNMAPDINYFKTDILLDTEDLKNAQESYEIMSSASGEDYTFQNRFSSETSISTGARLGQNNYKLMFNLFPFESGKFYIAGGVYYSRSRQREDLLTLEGHAAKEDWAALCELREKTGTDYNMSVCVGEDQYPLIEDESETGYLISSIRIDPLKYYAGMGLGRCIPNRFLGLQLEIGAMIFQNAELYCQGESAGSLSGIGTSMGYDIKDIADNMNKYSIYPQVALRLCFGLF